MRKLALTLLGALAFLLVLVGGAEGARAQEVPLIRVALSEGTPSASFQGLPFSRLISAASPSSLALTS